MTDLEGKARYILAGNYEVAHAKQHSYVVCVD